MSVHILYYVLKCRWLMCVSDKKVIFYLFSTGFQTHTGYSSDQFPVYQTV